jgi:hypothetical protein
MSPFAASEALGTLFSDLNPSRPHMDLEPRICKQGLLW